MKLRLSITRTDDQNEAEGRGRRREKKEQSPSRSKPPQRWQLHDVVNHVTFAGDRMIAWYLAEPQTWSFRSLPEGEDLILSYASRLSKLTGNTIHGRVTSRPYPVSHWARAAYQNAPAPQSGFEAMLKRDQLHMAEHAQADKLVYFGVDLGVRGVAVRALTKVMAGAADRELQLLQKRLDSLDDVMRGRGLEAVPATGNDMEWLLARSLALGCPVPVPTPEAAEQMMLNSDDLDEFTESVSWGADPFAPTVQITSSINGTPVTRHVCVLTVARVADLDIPESHEPWMSKLDGLPFPVEWSFRVHPRTPEETSKEMSTLSNRIAGQVDHWSIDHGKRPPKQLGRQAARAADVEDEMRREFTGLSTRTRGWYRIAVSGETEQEAVDRAQAVTEKYSPQIKVVRQLDQYHLAREFVPGEPLANTAHARKFPITKVAAGLPTITAEVGDRRGFHIAETVSIASRAACIDPWYLPEVVETSGLIPLIGTPGSGKTTLMGLLIVKSVLSGVRGVGMDPAGRLHHVFQLPELAPLTRSVNVLGGHPGSLSPYGVVPEPNHELIRVDCESEEEFAEKLQLARAAAISTRRDLAFTIMTWCLSMELSREKEVRRRLHSVVLQAPGLQSSSITNVLDVLKAGNGLDQEILMELRAARERELGRLFFGAQTRSRGDRERQQGLDAARFTMFNLRGLEPPDETKIPMEEWTPEQRLARPIMNLACWSALHLIYRGDPNERKLFSLDEADEVTSGSGAGRALVAKLSADSRKNNCATLVSTQNAGTVLGTNINNFVGAAFVGRTRDEDAQRDALQLLGKPEGQGYEEILAGLSPRSRRSDERLNFREFIYSDGLGGEGGAGGMERIRVTLDHHPELKQALNTTADPTKRIGNAKNSPEDEGAA